MAYRLIFTSPRGAKGLRKQYRVARDAGLRAAAEEWVKNILPGHFTEAAASKYRYAKRTKGHIRRKAREGRGQDPNVYTGRLRQKILGTQPVVRVNKRGAVLVWKGLPKYAYVTDTMEFVAKDWRWNDLAVSKLSPEAQLGVQKWRRNHPETQGGMFRKVMRPDKVRELTTMSRDDADVLGKTFRSTFQRLIKEIKP